jgi:hypothetical protein
MGFSFEIGESEGQKAILIDGELFDWGLDDASIKMANEQKDIKSVHADIRDHFLDSLEEVIGFRPTMAQVNEALRKGIMS